MKTKNLFSYVCLIFLSFSLQAQIDLPSKKSKEKSIESKEAITKNSVDGTLLFDLDGVVTINGIDQNVKAGIPIRVKYSNKDQYVFRTEDELIVEDIKFGKGRYVVNDNFNFTFAFKENYVVLLKKKSAEKEKNQQLEEERLRQEDFQKYVASILQPLQDDFISIDEKVIHYDGFELGMDAFQISTKEVTKRQYKLFKEITEIEKTKEKETEKAIVSVVLNSKTKVANPKENKMNIDWTSDEEGLRMDKHEGLNEPISFITYKEAKEFCEWLNTLDNHHYYRLPKTYEWDFVMSAGFVNDYPWPSDIEEFEVEEYANLKDSSVDFSFSNLKKTGHRWNDGYVFKSPVASYKPNAMGVFDLAGNVAEWTEDSSRNKPGFKIIKGGSFFVNMEKVKLNKSTMTAASFDQNKRHYGIGMRLVRIKKN